VIRRMRTLTAPGNDQGAALLFALIIVTVVALVSAAVLSFSDTSVRTTVALRDQASAAYTADGAAQAAIRQLSNVAYPNNCAAATGDALDLGTATVPFYSTSQSTAAPRNASVLCTPDTTSTAGVPISSANKPANAVLTVGTLVGDAQVYGQANKDVNITNGNVVSNSKVDATAANLYLSGTGVHVYVPNSSSCIAPNNITTPTETGCLVSSTNPYPTPTDVAPSVTSTPPLNPAPTCSGSYREFFPGFYDSPTALTTCSTATVTWFSPGVYYFNFPAASNTWTVTNTVVGGTPLNSSGVPITTLAGLANLASPNSLHGSCLRPQEQTGANQGVEFVMGGPSQFDMGTSSLEICATYQANTPPVALYAPTTALTLGSRTLTIPTSCATSSCSLLVTPTAGQADFHIRGFTYAPRSRMDLTLKNSPNGQTFNWGIVLRGLTLNTNGTSPTTPYIQLPPDNSGGVTTYSTMYLRVWTCVATASPCPRNVNPQLSAKVKIIGSPPVVTVLSWSVQR
jgi:Tfp pilus assembly protein PilX